MQPTIFFDGACPLCRREIDHYRRLDAGGRCRWVDISLESEALAAYGIDYRAAMAGFTPSMCRGPSYPAWRPSW